MLEGLNVLPDFLICRKKPFDLALLQGPSFPRLSMEGEAKGKISLRKEVIQPQVLLQLPCYDFTPITDHTLGTGFPYGFAQRLLVQPAFVM